MATTTRMRQGTYSATEHDIVPSVNSRTICRHGGRRGQTRARARPGSSSNQYEFRSQASPRPAEHAAPTGDGCVNAAICCSITKKERFVDQHRRSRASSAPNVEQGDTAKEAHANYRDRDQQLGAALRGASVGPQGGSQRRAGPPCAEVRRCCRVLCTDSDPRLIWHNLTPRTLGRLESRARKTRDAV